MDPYQSDTMCWKSEYNYLDNISVACCPLLVHVEEVKPSIGAGTQDGRGNYNARAYGSLFKVVILTMQDPDSIRTIVEIIYPPC